MKKIRTNTTTKINGTDEFFHWLVTKINVYITAEFWDIGGLGKVEVRQYLKRKL